ncbi:YihY/virulence factor BrkB family protein [Subtercola boreus]|uniref:Ribonuclease BN n=1 Tax=Subtercola boreus TaxID=120213 RepID=A0A3E0WAR7_9MICO|nr:YihY/virulence factor BrkB family protein [Subtercola boreus]RFA19038.1 ribonuclease BN [Subtercola boreus]RFA19176.1 ribonuclease BN [Subtercola boreus]RFA25638.1 ribonuclease BN [Subtercola boreus]
MSDIGASEKLKNAPAPDDARKPDGPTDVDRPAWKYVFRKTLREFGTDQCTDIAASLVYYSVLAMFPALIALLSLLGVIGQGQQATDALLEVIGSFAPADTVETVRGILEQFTNSPAAGFGLVFGIVLAIWSASGFVTAFSRAMNRIYEIDEGRPFWKLKPLQLLVTVIVIVLILVVLVILVISGPVTDALGSALGLGQTVQIVWSIAKWPVLALAVVLIIAILYYATPNAKQPRFRWMSMGALLALVVLVLASLAFIFYVTTFANYAKNYGSLAGVIIFLLWLWIANMALLFGAEFDAELERGRQLQAGIEAEENIQLPPRDTRKSEKAAKKEQDDVDRGRELRERASARTNND